MKPIASTLLLASLLVAAPADEKRLEPDHAPTPFTAAEIRTGCPEGRMAVYLLEAPGREAIKQTMRFLKCDEEGADLEVARAKKDGTAIGKPVTQRGTWKEFQAHGSFPEKATKVTEEAIETPAGKFDCWLYTVTEEEEGSKSVQRLWFAKKLAGPPVKMTTEIDGKVVSTMTLQEDK